MNILLISGHGGEPFDSGATGYFNNVQLTEYDLALNAVNHIGGVLNNEYQCHVDLYPRTRDAFKDCKNNKFDSYVDLKKYDYVLEVHFNAAIRDLNGDGRQKGSEIWIDERVKDRQVETNILANLKAIGLNSRGIKNTTSLTVIKHCTDLSVHAALLEICFIDDHDDLEFYFNNQERVLNSIANSMAQSLNIKRKPLEVNIGDTIYFDVSCLRPYGNYSFLDIDTGKVKFANGVVTDQHKGIVIDISPFNDHRYKNYNYVVKTSNTYVFVNKEDVIKVEKN